MIGMQNATRVRAQEGGATVDWSRWMVLSTAEQEALWHDYREILRNESARARASNYARMDAAIRRAYARPA